MNKYIKACDLKSCEECDEIMYICEEGFYACLFLEKVLSTDGLYYNNLQCGNTKAKEEL